MGLGVVTGSLSIVRTALDCQNESLDPTWDSIPNWYWRSWEVFFGIVAACIPTLRPGYKWLIGELKAKITKITSGGQTKPMKPTSGPFAAEKWTAPKPSSVPLKRSMEQSLDSSMAETTLVQEEDFLPLQNFDPSLRASIENYPSGKESQGGHQSDNGHYPKYKDGRERKAGLHLPGDLSTHRPGHFKRLDSEARIGGGHGYEEVEDRI